jgi:hypothetical protein
MKKILLLVLAFVMFKVGYSQYPIQQFIGADSAVVTSKGGLQGRFINVVFADTTAANSQRVRQYPGAMIYASGKLWVRNTTATGWTELAYGPIQVTNIYNSDGTLTGNRELDGDGNNLTFTAVRKFSLSGDSLDYTLDPAGNLRIGLGNQQFIMRGDTASLSRRLSYNTNLGSSFTKHSVVDKNYVDSSITSSPSGTVTSVATNNSTGITGGTITSTGTLAIDTLRISTRAWRQKGIDSVQSNLTSGLALKLNISDTATMLSPYLRKVDTTAMLSPYKTFYPRTAISLTTTGSIGAATYNNSTGVLNVPQYTDQFTGTVTSVATNTATGITGGTITTTGTLAIDTNLISTRAWRQKGIDSVASLANTRIGGSGTTNYVSKFTASGTIGNSQIFDNGTQIGIGTSSVASYGTILEVRGPSSNPNNVIVATTNTWTQLSAGTGLRLGTGATSGNTYGVIDVLQSGGNSAGGNLVIVPQGGVVGIGTTSPSGSYRLDVSGSIRSTTGAAFGTSSGNVLIGTTTDAGFKLDVNGTARINGVLTFGATPTIESFSANTQIKITASTGLTISSDRWNSNTSTSSYILNGYSTKNFITTNSANGSFNSFDFSASNTYFPTIAVSYNQKLINGAMTIQSTAVANFFGLDIRPTDNSSSIANNVYAIYADATLGTNTSANRWAGYFVGRGYFSQALSIGTTSPNASALLDITSTTKGFLPPRMTGAQAEAIATPAEGLMIYSNNGNGTTITSTGWWGYNGTTWVKLN